MAMPILDVEKARTVLFVKRSMASGYAGGDNDLFIDRKPEAAQRRGDAVGRQCAPRQRGQPGIGCCIDNQRLTGRLRGADTGLDGKTTKSGHDADDNPRQTLRLYHAPL